MPGIVGLITKKPREWAEPQVLRMVEALRHESFYLTGTLVDASLGIYAGWITRKGSFSDRMPLCNERGDVVLLFSGEEYPEHGVALRLKERGHEFDAEGPAYLVHLYEEEPCSFPAGLNGRFHGLLTDRNRGTTMLFNDRFGLHRLYYHESHEGFYFAAEAKALLAVRPELRTADPRGLGEFVTCGCVLENRTFFDGIHVLPPAAAWRFRGDSVERRGTYFEPREWETQPPSEPEAYYRELRGVFSRILPRYFNGRERIAMSLTGGLDTRMIMAWRKASPGSLPCYTFGGTLRDSRDVVVARQVARACGQSASVIHVGREFLSRFPQYAERTVYLTDGCARVGDSVDLYAHEQAREIAPVRMTGNFGGEVLRRVRSFKPVDPPAGVFRAEFLSHIAAAKETYAGLLAGHPLSFAVFRQAPWHHYGVLALEQTQLTLRSPYLDNDLVRTVFRAPESACVDNTVCLRLIADGDPALQRIWTDRGPAGNHTGLRGTIVRRLLEFTVKAEYAYDDSMPQWLARIDSRFSSFHLERFFLGRHKFAHFRVWYRDALSDYVRDILLDPRTLSRPYLKPDTLEAVVRSHLRGDGNYTIAIHKALTLELVHRLFLDPR